LWPPVLVMRRACVNPVVRRESACCRRSELRARYDPYADFRSLGPEARRDFGFRASRS
jgi:hypothetical protein